VWQPQESQKAPSAQNLDQIGREI
jgi:hypothetical protein